MAETIISKRRHELGMTQAQLAERSGIHLQSIAKLERGERPLDRLWLSTALALADALDLDPHEFLK